MAKKPKVVDLFCGCGGLSYGLKLAGYEIILGIDNWKDSLETYAINHRGAKTEEADLSMLNPEDIAKKYHLAKNGIDLIVGGPPCQGFSISGKRRPDDPRNSLYRAFVAFVDYFKPKGFLMENVPHLISMENGSIKDKILNDFQSLCYKVSYKVLKASDYGVPQDRRRVFFVGLRNGSQFIFPEALFGEKKRPPVSSSEAISDLPEYGLENGSRYPIGSQSSYQKSMRENSHGLYNHQSTEHSEKTKKIVSMVPDGGNYRNLPEQYQGIRKVHIAWTRINSKRPSFTIDTGHRHHFHYKFDRVPTVRESARIQSFPDRFIFVGSKTSQYKQVGNAVPPLLAKALGIKLHKYV